MNQAEKAGQPCSSTRIESPRRVISTSKNESGSGTFALQWRRRRLGKHNCASLLDKTRAYVLLKRVLHVYIICEREIDLCTLLYQSAIRKLKFVEVDIREGAELLSREKERGSNEITNASRGVDENNCPKLMDALVVSFLITGEVNKEKYEFESHIVYAREYIDVIIARRERWENATYLCWERERRV